MGFAAKRKRICAINEKKAPGYNLQIIWQKQQECDVAALFPVPGKPSCVSSANSVSGAGSAGLSGRAPDALSQEDAAGRPAAIPAAPSAALSAAPSAAPSAALPAALSAAHRRPPRGALLN